MVRTLQHFTLFSLLLSFFARREAFLETRTITFCARTSQQQVSCTHTTATTSHQQTTKTGIHFPVADCDTTGCFPRFGTRLECRRSKMRGQSKPNRPRLLANTMHRYTHTHKLSVSIFLVLCRSWALDYEHEPGSYNKLNYRFDRTYLNVQFKMEAGKDTTMQTHQENVCKLRHRDSGGTRLAAQRKEYIVAHRMRIISIFNFAQVFRTMKN